jgi:hypothetical protein
MTLVRKRVDAGNRKGSNRSRCVENSVWERLWTCRQDTTWWWGPGRRFAGAYPGSCFHLLSFGFNVYNSLLCDVAEQLVNWERLCSISCHWKDRLQGVFKKRPNFCYKEFTLQHFKHCPLQSSPLYWRYTVPNVSSIVGMLSGTHFLWWRAVLLSHFSGSSRVQKKTERFK